MDLDPGQSLALALEVYSLVLERSLPLALLLPTPAASVVAVGSTGHWDRRADPPGAGGLGPHLRSHHTSLPWDPEVPLWLWGPHPTQSQDSL